MYDKYRHFYKSLKILLEYVWTHFFEVRFGFLVNNFIGIHDMPQIHFEECWFFHMFPFLIGRCSFFQCHFLKLKKKLGIEIMGKNDQTGKLAKMDNNDVTYIG